MYATSLIFVLATPVLAVTLLMVAVERIFQVGIFDPRFGWRSRVVPAHVLVLLASGGLHHGAAGDGGCERDHSPLLHASHCPDTRPLRISSMGIAVLGFLVWGHHMFVAGTSVYSAMVFSMLSYLVAVPSAIKVFNWTATIYKGSVSWDTPMLYAIGFVGLFTIGGMTGLFLAALGLDVHVTDTYFVIAHFHYIMVGGTVMGFLGGVHYWWPKISGRMYPEGLARLSALTIFLGFNLTFLPTICPGISWHAAPLRRLSGRVSDAERSLDCRREILGVGYILPLCYLLWSWKYGRVASSNPWRATGLEWKTLSPPPVHNFERTPVVTWRPYDYEAQREELKLA